MSLTEKWIKQKKRFLTDFSVCKENLELFGLFFSKEEVKLKRMNGLMELDKGSYSTLSNYVGRFRTVNKWFENKPWVDLTSSDIEKVYNDLEDGKILNKYGKPYKDTESFYNKVMRSKPFKLAGKDDMVREVMEFHHKKKNTEVRFFDFSTPI